MVSKKKKIAICHYRVGGTDGVSLEIAKRKKILENHGCEVKLIAGPRSYGADFIIEELEWEEGAISRIKENGFIHFDRKDFDDMELEHKIFKISDNIEKQLDAIQKKENFDSLLVHNIFCFGGHISAARAFTNFIKKNKIPTIATHHDFYWERKEFKVPRNNFLKKYVNTYLPPKNSYIKHVVINSIAKNELQKRRGINSTIIPDIFDFSQKEWRKDSFNKSLPKEFGIKKNDFVILQATRIVPRKGIEIAVDFAAALQKQMKNLNGKTLYNNKKINEKSRLVFVLAGYYEKVDKPYYLKIREKINESGIKGVFVNGSGKIGQKRSYRGGIKQYSLWDCYAYADLITFPSLWEGWGNQFIEAIFARKPIVVFEYPVYKKDIGPEGYQTISLGKKAVKGKEDLTEIPKINLKKAVQKTKKWLLDKKLDKKLDKNFQIGKKFHDNKILEEFLLKSLKL